LEFVAAAGHKPGRFALPVALASTIVETFVHAVFGYQTAKIIPAAGFARGSRLLSRSSEKRGAGKTGGRLAPAAS
jgi:hypothetical protein